MLRDRRSILAVALCVLSGRAGAENLAIKPGLWESTSSYETKGTPPMPASERAEMERAMAKMAPEARTKMQAAMKGGQSNSGKPVISRSCVLKEDLNKPFAFGSGKEDGSCQRTIIKASSTVQEIRLECMKGTQKSVGTVRIVAASPESWTGTIDGTISDTGGATEMKSKIVGKWLGTDCGNVKPAAHK